MMEQTYRHKINDDGRRVKEAGFSVLELVIAFAVIIIMSALTIYSFANHKNAYKTDDAAMVVVSFMRQASQRALTQRQPQRLEINLTDNTIQLIDENTSSSGTTDDVVVKSQTLELMGEIRAAGDGSTTRPSFPTNITQPTAPAEPNYTPAAFTKVSNKWVWSARYMSDGRVVDGSGNLISATLSFWTPNTNVNQYKPATAVRAITFFGPTGSTKLWAYSGSGTTFVAR
jgi:Tfp pilus assembly protein FimT